MTISHIAIFFIILQIILHFYKKSINNPNKSNSIINLMLYTNIFILFVFLHLYIKKHKPIYLLPIILVGFNYFYYGHSINNRSGHAWSLLGGLELGILGMHLS